MTVNQQHLKQAWNVSQVSTKEDWLEWMHRISVEFMKESPSHALRACMSLVDVHPPLAKELFNAAFISCWGELYDQYQVSGCDILSWNRYSSSFRRRISFELLKLPSHQAWPLPSSCTAFSIWPSSWSMKRRHFPLKTERSESTR